MNEGADPARFNIGEAASRSGVSAKMIRRYESLALLPSVDRTDSGYRLYGEKEVHTLRFIKRSRDLGFGMPEIAQLLKLWQNRRRSSAEVRRVASIHVANLDQRIAEMEEMRQTLQHLIDCCHGDHRPACPILEELNPARHSARGCRCTQSPAPNLSNAMSARTDASLAR